jgi:hypothetical protein
MIISRGFTLRDSHRTDRDDQPDEWFCEGSLIKRFGLIALAIMLLTGCPAHYISPEDPKIYIPDRSSEVTVGRMDRAAVRSVLGTPKLSSAYWGFDLFRADTEQTDVLFAITPWPIPFARIKDQVQRFTLVAYDINGPASAVATGLFRRPASWRNVSPIQFDFPSLHLRAGDLMFFVDPEGSRDVNLLVSPRGRDRFLQHARASKSCTVVLGCGDRGCADQVSADAGPARRLPVRIAHVYWFRQGERDSWLHGAEPHGSDARMPWLEALVAVKFAAGEHALEFSAKHLSGRTSLTFTCRPGEVTYWVISASSNESFWKSTLVDWKIDRSDRMPERFVRRMLVLMDDGQWYVDAEQ